MIACQQGAKSVSDDTASKNSSFELPELGYAFDALAPNIDAQTMEIHHGKHHAGYVRKFNAAVKEANLSGSLVDIISAATADNAGIRNNGGGHYNHSLFWSSMSPTGGAEPSGDLADAINSSFGDYSKFKDLFSMVAKTRFGSGWAWLVQDATGGLFVTSTPNQDNPLMTNLVEKSGTPLLGLDVWEHAYYLNYQNRRGDYVSNFFNVIDWNAVAKRLA
ncbi:MAG: superoxide dismutase [Bacteroidota bacterium]